jgi:hypothetical protein
LSSLIRCGRTRCFPASPIRRACSRKLLHSSPPSGWWYTSAARAIAYIFGSVPASRPGRHVLSGETVARNNNTKLQHTRRGRGQSEDVDYTALPHPCPRRYEHVAWLVGIYGEDSILDPFMGTGTTLEAAKRAGFPCIGIDHNEANCELASQRLSQNVLPLEVA